ncbi:vang-like protein 2-B [Babylonia areolata]|uniref:vang-like protein 2-B n=1 Tax=Babylonia areolata TaxID=304850 RepID=UPI003FCF0268
MDGAESVRSERSTRSQGSSYYHSAPHWQAPPPPPQSPPHDAHPHPMPHPYPRRHPSSASSHAHSRHGSGRDRERGGGEGDHYMARGHLSGQESDVENHRPREERIEVQVIPQDDNWGDNTTAVTGNTSETGFSMENLNKFHSHNDFSGREGFNCVHYLGTAVAVILSLFGFLSPIAMVILPRLNIIDWSYGELSEWEMKRCPPQCEGLLISFSFKLLILLLGTLAVFFRHPKATMPRMFVFRAVVLFLVFVLTFAFWLFYGVRIVQEGQTEYHRIVQFADSLVDGLLFIHYLAVVLLEIRQLQPQFVVRVTRSPDGEFRCYNIGLLSVQRAAVTVLEHYYRDFPAYNPYLDMVGRRSGKQNLTEFKVYDVDGTEQNQSVSQGRSRAMFAAAARRRDSGHNDRFYDEVEYERRVRKRKARLVVAAEEAFTHIKRLQEEQGPTIPMDPQEAAQAVFPSMARALQKYLRITRQQPRYSMESVLAHLATCISHDLSPRAFIARYLTQGAVIMSEHDRRAVDRWVIVCEQNVVREVEEGTQFQLRHGDISLMCYIRKLPHFSMTEDIRDPKNNKFVLRLNSETSV